MKPSHLKVVSVRNSEIRAVARFNGLSGSIEVGRQSRQETRSFADCQCRHWIRQHQPVCRAILKGATNDVRNESVS